MSKILLVEDDQSLAIGLKYTFTEEGYTCIHAKTFEETLTKFDDSFDIIIMDVELTDGNGYDLCKIIRAKSDIPIIFLTSYDDEVNIVMGLDIGGDDYITKPFQLKVLMSRIKANIRRDQSTQKKVIREGDLTIDSESFAAYIGNIDLELTATEYKLLLLLINNMNKTTTRTLIHEKLWDHKGKYIDDNTISVHIRHLREKLRHYKVQVVVTTIRGIGYRLENVN